MLQAYLRLIRFDKPIGTLLLLWPTLWALWFAYAGMPPVSILCVFSLGVFLTRSAGCAINDFADSKYDSEVKRTLNRPLATGEISRKQALFVTAGFSILAFALAWGFLKLSTLMWAFPALIIFISYPFFKRFFPLPQAYLGIAFSFGIPMVFVEASGSLNLDCYLLFIANFCWVLAYDTIYALVDIDDDLRIGIKTSAITFGRWVIEIILACYIIFLGILFYLGWHNHLPIFYYLGLCVVAYLIWQIYQQIACRNRELCFKAFLANNNIGLALFICILVSFL